MTSNLKTQKPTLDKRSGKESTPKESGTSLRIVLLSLGATARIDDEPKPKGGKAVRPRATPGAVKDLNDDISQTAAAMRDEPEYQRLTQEIAAAQKDVDRLLRERPLGEEDMWKLSYDPAKNKLAELKTQIKPHDERIAKVTDQAKEIEQYLADPTAKIDPQLKRAVDVRAEKTGSMTALKQRVGADLEKARNAPAYVEAKRELDAAQKEVNRLVKERPVGEEDMWQLAYGPAKERLAKAKEAIKPMNGPIDALVNQSDTLEKALADGATTGLPPEMQNKVDQQAETANLFRDVQDRLDKEIAKKDEQMRNLLEDKGLTTEYNALESEKQVLARTLKKEPRIRGDHWDEWDAQISATREKVAKLEKELSDALGPHVEEFTPLVEAKQSIQDMAKLAGDRVGAMNFELDGGDPLAAQLQGLVDQAEAEAAGKDFEAKAKDVLVREAGVKRADKKAQAAAEKSTAARGALDLAAKGTPALKDVWEKSVEAKAALELKVTKQTEAAELAATKAKEYEELYREIQSGDPAEQFSKLERLNLLTGDLDAAKQGLRTANKELGEANTAAESAQTTLDNAIGEQAKSNPKLDETQKAFLAAKGDADKADQEQAAAQGKLDEAKAAEKAAKGRAQVLKMTPDVERNFAAVKDKLNELSKKGLVIWNDGGAEAIRKEFNNDKAFNEFEAKIRKIASDYETMKANGATTEELKALYQKGGIDEKWWPPQFRKEEQNWVAMKDFITDENVKAQTKEESTKIDKFISAAGKGELGGKLSTAIEKLGSETGQKITQAAFGKELTEEQAEKVAGFVALAGAICGLGKAIATVGKSGEELVQYKETDPVEEMMLQDELVDAMTEMAKSGLELTGEAVKMLWKELPALGVISDAMDVMKSLTEAAERIQNAMEDQRLFEEAQQSGHQAEKALGQMANRDKHLAARAGSDAAISALSAAAGVATMTGVGAQAGAGMKAVATGAKTIKSGLEIVVDKTAAQTAKTLLEKAQAGNADARSELFQHHPRYAKGLISLMAMEGDSMALACLKNHGLTEEMIAKSSAPIIKKYLMKRFKETDDPSSWTDTWKSIKGAASSAANAAIKVAGLFVALFDKINIAVREANDPSALVSSVRQLDGSFPSMNELASTVSTCQSVRFRRDALALSADGSEQQKTEMTELDKALAEATKNVQDLRGKIAGSNTQLAILQANVQIQLRSKATDKDLLECKQRTESLLGKHLQALDAVMTSL